MHFSHSQSGNLLTQVIRMFYAQLMCSITVRQTAVQLLKLDPFFRNASSQMTYATLFTTKAHHLILFLTRHRCVMSFMSSNSEFRAMLSTRPPRIESSNQVCVEKSMLVNFRALQKLPKLLLVCQAVNKAGPQCCTRSGWQLWGNLLECRVSRFRFLILLLLMYYIN